MFLADLSCALPSWREVAVAIACPFGASVRAMPRFPKHLLASLIPLSLLSACGAAPEPAKPDQPVYARYADDAAISEAALKNAIAPFFEDEALAETRAILIMHGGLLVAERYAPGYGPDSRLISWSMAKSVTATLAGFMVADGLLVLDDPAPVSEWANAGDARNRITLRQLLHMSSGIDHTETAEDGTAIYKADTTRMLFLDGREHIARYAEGRMLEAPPGSKFEYSSATSNIIADIMTRTLTDSRNPQIRRDAMLEYARGRLFEPLGMTSAFPEFDRQGTMLGGSIIHATGRDWAKFGEFLRNNGSVRGAQLLPTNWLRFMKSPSANNPAYGGHIWLNRGTGGARAPLFPGKAPSDVFAAIGHLGQYVIVSPQHKLTIVRLGKTQDEELGPIKDQLAKVINLFPSG
jgi:CubicO group peptidase (beta-lactamase class C family)